MEVDGKEFLRNVSLEQDKAQLMEEQKKLEQKKRDAVKKENSYNINKDDSAYVDISYGKDDSDETAINQLQDIMLEPDNNNKNKKKYIILILTMIILFIVIIVVIRISSNSTVEDQIKEEVKKPLTINKDEILNKMDTQDTVKPIIKQDLTTSDDLDIETTEKQEIILPEPIKEKPPVVIEQPKKEAAAPKDLFGLGEDKVKPVVKPKPVVKKVVPKQDSPRRKISNINPPKETNFTKKNNGKIEGYFVQIGAFSKKPTDKFLLNISRHGYDYTIYSIKVKGTIYNKVLIGPYPTKKTALRYINKIKKTFNNKKAYILKI
ncbi:MAG: SPOR domain-containing protein [Campylobacterota bacterium]|nr:SPOR domain-containing protein [Campylobacterota bacterium]